MISDLEDSIAKMAAGDIPIMLAAGATDEDIDTATKLSRDAGESATDSLREFDEATERRYIRKIDKRLVVLGFLCCK